MCFLSSPEPPHCCNNRNNICRQKQQAATANQDKQKALKIELDDAHRQGYSQRAGDADVLLRHYLNPHVAAQKQKKAQ